MCRRVVCLGGACLAVAALTLSLTGCISEIDEVRMIRPPFIDTHRTETVVVDVRNASGVEPFPLQDKIMAMLKAKGYTILPVPQTDQADVVLRVQVQWCGIENLEFTGEEAAGGAWIGAGLGALVGIAGHGRGGAVALGALTGAVIGAGAGALHEKMASKDVFTCGVAVRIKQKDKVQGTAIQVRLRKRDLTYERAIDNVSDRIATQIAGLF